MTEHTAENDAPVVWHDEAQRFNDLGLLDPPTFCACDDCLCVIPPDSTQEES